MGQHAAVADDTGGGKRPLLLDDTGGGKRPLLFDDTGGGKRPLLTDDTGGGKRPLLVDRYLRDPEFRAFVRILLVSIALYTLIHYGGFIAVGILALAGLLGASVVMFARQSGNDPFEETVCLPYVLAADMAPSAPLD